MINSEAIIFDFDGTLFQTDKLAIQAFNKTFEQLRSEGYQVSSSFTEADLLQVIGLTLEDIWRKLLPNLSQEAVEKASKYLLENELSGVKEGYGALFPEVVDTLLELKRAGFRLFIASNGQKEYVFGLADAFRIDHFFEGIYTAGEFETSNKDDLVKYLLENAGITKATMVGDRSSDISAGQTNNLFVVGCDFGFCTEGELAGANVIISNFSQLLELFI